MAGVLSSAISGLQASQIGLRTAGNNISNANTAGYSRQDVNFSTRPEQTHGSAGFLGNGVNVESVKRVVNDFLTTQLRLDSATFNQLDKYNTNIGKLDKLLSDSNTGLIGGLQSFLRPYKMVLTILLHLQRVNLLLLNLRALVRSLIIYMIA